MIGTLSSSVELPSLVLASALSSSSSKSPTSSLLLVPSLAELLLSPSLEPRKLCNPFWPFGTGHSFSGLPPFPAFPFLFPAALLGEMTLLLPGTTFFLGALATTAVTKRQWLYDTYSSSNSPFLTAALLARVLTMAG